MMPQYNQTAKPQSKLGIEIQRLRLAIALPSFFQRASFSGSQLRRSCPKFFLLGVLTQVQAAVLRPVCIVHSAGFACLAPALLPASAMGLGKGLSGTSERYFSSPNAGCRLRSIRRIATCIQIVETATSTNINM